MTLTNKSLISLIIAWAILGGLLMYQINKPTTAQGDVGYAEATRSTSTPNLANNTVLCSDYGVLDSIIAEGQSTGYLWVINASSTTHTNFATTSALLAAKNTGYGTSTTKYGVEADRGLVVSYTGTATTTITYRCGN